ncbi:hypothetical protein [Shewanella donghaensis]|uniref:hypothetical protein n=1 Tax=Shewanella donghaensis TaxID=238836 RepID=UPI00118396B6|nr:hypothetical protein [Shewanella donghaensis]
MDFTTWLALAAILGIFAVYTDHKTAPVTTSETLIDSKIEPHLKTSNTKEPWLLPYIILTGYSVYFFDIPHWDKAIYLLGVILSVILINFIVDKFKHHDTQWREQLYLLSGSIIINSLIIFFRFNNADIEQASLNQSSQLELPQLAIAPTLSVFHAGLAYVLIFIVQLINMRFKTEARTILVMLIIAANFIVPFHTSSFWWTLPVSVIISFITAMAIAEVECENDRSSYGAYALLYPFAIMMMLGMSVIFYVIASVMY